MAAFFVGGISTADSVFFGSHPGFIGNAIYVIIM
jgi:hypothetical protein